MISLKKYAPKAFMMFLAGFLIFYPIKSLAEEFFEKIILNKKLYSVKIDDESMKYDVSPPASEEISEKAFKAAFVKHEVENYLTNIFKQQSKELDKQLIKSSISLAGKSAKEAVLSPVESLEDPRVAIGAAGGVLEKNILGFAKGFISGWWENLPEAIEKRNVDPRMYIAYSIGQYNLLLNKKAGKIKELLKGSFTYKEAMKAYSDLIEIKTKMPALIRLAKAVNESKDKRFETDSRDYKEFHILEWKGLGENIHISEEDKPKLDEIIKRIWNRIYETSEYKEYITETKKQLKGLDELADDFSKQPDGQSIAPKESDESFQNFEKIIEFVKKEAWNGYEYSLEWCPQWDVDGVRGKEIVIGVPYFKHNKEFFDASKLFVLKGIKGNLEKIASIDLPYHPIYSLKLFDFDKDGIYDIFIYYCDGDGNNERITVYSYKNGIYKKIEDVKNSESRWKSVLEKEE